MRPPRHRLAAGALLALTAACAHAPAPPPSWRGVAWPEPPAAPLARLVAVHPDPEAPPPAPSAWDRVVTLATGVTAGASTAPRLLRPFGVAFGPDGSTLVADPDAARVTRFSLRGAPTDLTCRESPWVAPIGVAVGADGAVYVLDGAVVRMGGAACRALGASALQRPVALAVAPDRLFVADGAANEVVVLSLDGVLLGRWGGGGGGGGDRLGALAGLAVLPGGDLLAVDSLASRLVRFSSGGSVIGGFGATEGEGALVRPKAVAVDEGGRVYVSDAGRDAVLVFAADGTFAYTLGASGGDPGRFAHPAGLAAAAGRLAVADSYNSRIQVFELLGDGP